VTNTRAWIAFDIIGVPSFIAGWLAKFEAIQVDKVKTAIMFIVGLLWALVRILYFYEGVKDRRLRNDATQIENDRKRYELERQKKRDSNEQYKAKT
jgi:hypothetical protein